MVQHYKGHLLPNAVELRSNLTNAEQLLWSKIRRKQLFDFTFNRQKPIGRYIVDFYCFEARLVIELDGGQHYEQEGIVADQVRDRYLQEQGFTVLRFSNRDVLQNIDGVLTKITQHLNR